MISINDKVTLDLERAKGLTAHGHFAQKEKDYILNACNEVGTVIGTGFHVITIRFTNYELTVPASIVVKLEQ